MIHYYVETDGEVFLIEEAGRLRFPTSEAEIPFAITPLHEMRVAGERVRFCEPHLSEHPAWHHKDALIGWDHVEPLVRLAVNASLPRLVTEAVIVEAGRLLMVRANRGYNKDRWTLPGGFVRYGETPAQGAAREVREEVGVDCRVGELLGIESFIGRDGGFHWHMCLFEATLLSHEFDPPPDEIAQVRWMDFAQAWPHLKGFPTLRQALRRRYGAVAAGGEGGI